MFFGKSKEEVSERLANALRKNTLVTNLDPGTLARSLVDIFSEEFGDFYKELELTTVMGFVSTAKGQFLDMIGSLLNCTRLALETDNNYRSRIINQVYVVAGANETSIRLKVLSIPGVKNIIMKQFTKGTGSFSIYIITDDLITPQSILSQVESVVNESKAAGVFAEVKTPVLIPVELKVRLIFSDKVSDIEKTSIRQQAKQNIKTYIDNIALGGNFIVNEIVRTGMDASSKIIDVDFYSLKVNDMTQFVRNFQVDWDQRIVINKIEVL
jgi:hypothetical protein